jgi:hypothetical protein
MALPLQEPFPVEDEGLQLTLYFRSFLAGAF